MEAVSSYRTTENVSNPRTYYIPRPVVCQKKSYLILKRAFDLIFSFLGILILLIPMALIALLIVLDSPGNPIFKQERLGKDGKVFTILKFRTMYTYAPSNVPTNSLNINEYTTKFGRVLRVCSLDELPQLINILKGDMSFVGYRPVCLTEHRLNQLRARYGILTVKPGITGYAQINGRDNVTIGKKVQLDRYYLEHCSVRLDIYCLLKTIKVTLTKEGAK